MKKLLFFKSSLSNGDEPTSIPTLSKDKRRNMDIKWKKTCTENGKNRFQNSRHISSVSERKISEKRTISRSSSLVLRKSRSLSMSSSADLGVSRSHRKCPSNGGDVSAHLCDCYDCHFQLKEIDPKPTVDQVNKPRNDKINPGQSYSTSPHTSFGSSSFPEQVLDLYIDGEYIPDKYRQRSNSSSCNNIFITSDSASRTSLMSEKQRPESPRKLAKDVVERLLMLEQSRDQIRCQVSEQKANKEEVLSVREENDELKYQIRELTDQNGLLREQIDGFYRKEKEYVDKLSDEIRCRNSERKADKEEFLSLKEENDQLKYQIRELNDQNGLFQEQISGFYKKEKEYGDKLSDYDDMKRKLSDVEDKLRVSEEVRLCIERKLDEKEKENTELVKCISRLQRTCSDQEKSIDGLRQSLHPDNLENTTDKLRMEQLRLTEVEQTLRKHIQSYEVETHSLRQENIYLLERLKSTSKASGHSSIKLDQELLSSVQSLENTGLRIMSNSIQMNVNLTGLLKRRCKTDGFIETRNIIDYHGKVQSLQKEGEEFARSLRNVASVLTEKSGPDFGGVDDDKGGNIDRNDFQAGLKAELKAERLLTSLMKEKLFHKEKEVELIQTELARTLRNVDVLKSEIQAAFDSASCVNHKMKNIELQMIKKDGVINQLQHTIHSHEQDLSSTKGILSKVTQERDLMWEEVKQYSEKNMLLNCEIESMKKRIETLEEDTLLKDGQISILKDSLSNSRPTFDSLFTPELGDSFNL